MPALARRAKSSGVKMPLSPTTTRFAGTWSMYSKSAIPHAANTATTGYALLTVGAANLIAAHGTPDQVARYVEITRTSVFYLDPHLCTRCRYRSTELLWQCPHCHDWNTFVEERIAPAELDDEVVVLALHALDLGFQEFLHFLEFGN